MMKVYFERLSGLVAVRREPEDAVRFSRALLEFVAVDWRIHHHELADFTSNIRL